MSEKRNPLAIIRHYIDFATQTLAQYTRAGGTERVREYESKIYLLKALESDMEIEYFLLGDKTTLGALRPGAVFATEDGVYAVKSEYHYDAFDPVADERDVNRQCRSVLLASGEYAHFQAGNATVVYEVIMPKGDEA